MRRILITTLFLLLSSAPIAADQQQPTSSASVQGTVHVLQLETGTIQLVTGVGMALRLVDVTVLPATRIAGAGGKLGASSSIKRGDIVRVQGRWSGKQLLADRIDRVVTP